MERLPYVAGSIVAFTSLTWSLYIVGITFDDNVKSGKTIVIENSSYKCKMVNTLEEKK